MNKEIKIIDLLNMIAEGKEGPKKIKYDNTIYKYDEQYDYQNKLQINYYSIDKGGDFFNNVYCYSLNDEVEIIEENNNKIGKLIINEDYKFSSSTIKDFTMEDKRLLDSNFKTLSDKINEIIDKINNMEE